MEFIILSGDFNDFFEEDTDDEEYNPEYDTETSSSHSDFEYNTSEEELLTSSEEEV